jgi:hypothetical protein
MKLLIIKLNLLFIFFMLNNYIYSNLKNQHEIYLSQVDLI